MRFDKNGIQVTDGKGKRIDPIHTTPLDEMVFTPASFHPLAMPVLGQDDFGRKLENLLAASSPGGIEQQEAQAQVRLISGCDLPVKMNEMFAHTGYDDAIKADNTEDAYAKMGIKILGVNPADKIFFEAELPEGWVKKATDHSMWSEVIDNKGRKRLSIFFKGAFYDYEAFSNVLRRFRVTVECADAYTEELTREQRETGDFFGRVYDGEVVAFQTQAMKQEMVEGRYWDLDKDLKKEALAECETWLITQGFPDWKDVFKYWE